MFSNEANPVTEALYRAEYLVTIVKNHLAAGNIIEARQAADNLLSMAAMLHTELVIKEKPCIRTEQQPSVQARTQMTLF